MDMDISKWEINQLIFQFNKNCNIPKSETQNIR